MWDDDAWEKNGALGGVVFVILAVIGGFLAGAMPARQDTPAEIGEWFSDNDSAIQLGAFLTALGVIALAWWFGSLWKAMTRADDGSSRTAIIALVGFVISGIGAMTALSINAGIASVVDGGLLGEAGDASSIFFSLSSVAFGFSAVGYVVMALAVAGLIMRSGFLPKWVAGLSFVVAATAVISSIGITSDADFFTVFGFIGFLVWDVWILAVAGTLYQKASATAA